MSDTDIQKLLESYETLPYMSQAYTQSHPNRLAVLATIFNIRPTPITRCRVLELGCASGGNIIPLAWYLPDSEFVGIEISEVQANAAQTAVNELGLGNITIQHKNIMDVGADLGRFDYIICHGVFSWVPRQVQDMILSIASKFLNPQGIAYISYNTYPGWHIKEMIRNMMLYHASHFDSLEQRLNQARASINFLADAVEKEGDRIYGLALKQELEMLKKSDDWYLYHDYMEVVNTPVYFHQFCSRAEEHGLQYLAEADFGVMFSDDFSARTNHTLEEISLNIVQKEQYMDFLRNRAFRQTLLCRKELDIERNLNADSIKSLSVMSKSTPENESVDLSPQITERFAYDDGMYIETRNPALKTALLILKSKWPLAVQFGELVDETTAYHRKVFGPSIETQAVKKDLGRELLQCYIHRTVEFTTWQNEFRLEKPKTPKVSLLARYQAQKGNFIVSPGHERIALDQMSCHIIRMFDGENTTEKIAQTICDYVEEGFIPLTLHGVSVSDPEHMGRLVNEKIERVLAVLQDSRLLIQ